MLPDVAQIINVTTMKTGSLLRKKKTCCPDILTAVRLCIDNIRRSEGKGFTQTEIAPEDFELVPSSSVDYALMQKSRLLPLYRAV
jgi:mannose-1-phosphate guanylyltransferase